jgi:hypothetical protein
MPDPNQENTTPNKPLTLQDLPPEVLLISFGFSTSATLCSLSQTSRFFYFFANDDVLWKNKIKEDFGITIDLSQPGIHHPKTIYRHLTILKRLEKRSSPLYGFARDGSYPPLCKEKLTDETIEMAFRHLYLNQAAQVGNLALVQWLTHTDRAESRVTPDQGTLYDAARSGNLALVQ